MTPRLRSGQLAQAAGVNVQTLRYYERRGIVTPPERTWGGHRLYPPETVTALRVVKTAQRLGFSLSEVAELLEATQPRHGGRNDPGLPGRLQTKLAEVEAKIADLAIIAGMLRAAQTAGCADLVACAGNTCCPLPFADLAEAHADPTS